MLLALGVPVGAVPRYSASHEPGDESDATVAATIQGVWLSPDWVLPGGRTYREADVRAVARPLMRGLRANGVNAVFLETFVRGSSIAPSGDARLPTYAHLTWDFGQRGTRTVDALQIFIDEADAQGIAVHAWVHLFYWRMDNEDVYQPWHRTPSLWDDLLHDYLVKERDALAERYEGETLRKAIDKMLPTIKDGIDNRLLSQSLREAGIESNGHPLGTLLTALQRAGCPAPDFMLLGSLDAPFPPHPGRNLCPIYLNPAHPVVQDRLIRSMAALSTAHPDLAGIHLDHVRYPMDAQGIPTAWEPRGRESLYFNDTNPVLKKRFDLYLAQLKSREDVLRNLVTCMKQKLYRTQQLSAAVLPLYYVERGADVSRLNGYDFSAQDWYRWDVDFVVPMMYGFDPWRIRTLIRRYEDESRAARNGEPSPSVVPGISGLRITSGNLLHRATWVYFDLSLGLDVKYEKERDEDYKFVPKKDL